jgi:hypothetical protein
MTDKITVKIQCREVVAYNQDVEMTKEQFNSLDFRLSSKDRRERERAEEEVFDWIDRSDVFDSDDQEIEDFEILV